MKQNSGIRVGGYFTFTCYDKDGNLKWQDKTHNLVTNVGLQHMLDVTFAGGTQVNPWYVGLTDGTPTVAAADTMASHAGWTEITAYSESVRQTYVDARTNQTVSNTASQATFSINGTATIGGGFLGSDSTKGGSTGTLLCEAAFTGGDRSAQSGDTVNVTYEFSAADDGV